MSSTKYQFQYVLADTAVDCILFFSEYRVIVTEQVVKETSIGQLTAGRVFDHLLHLVLDILRHA